MATAFSLIFGILKPILEAFFNAFAEKFTEPDITRVAPDPKPTLATLDIGVDSDLAVDTSRFDRLLEGA